MDPREETVALQFPLKIEIEIEIRIKTYNSDEFILAFNYFQLLDSMVVFSLYWFPW